MLSLQLEQNKSKDYGQECYKANHPLATEFCRQSETTKTQHQSGGKRQLCVGGHYIQAKVWHTKSKKIPYNATERIETGNIENKYKIKINNFEINLSKGVSKFEIYDTIVMENKFKIFSDFYLPISLIKITNKEQKEEQKNYTIDEAKNLGIEQLQEELDNEIEDKEKIVNKIINTYEKEDGIEIYITYEVLENIGTNEKIVF